MPESPEDFRPVLAKALVLQEQGSTDEAQVPFAQTETMAPAQFKDQIQQMANPVPTEDPVPLEAEDFPPIEPPLETTPETASPAPTD